MPKGNKSKRSGSFIRFMKCPYCDKKYEGDQKTVDKIFKLHLNTHNIFNPKIIEQPINLKPGQNIHNYNTENKTSIKFYTKINQEI